MFISQQGKIPAAENAIRKLYGKQKVDIVMNDLKASGPGSTDQDAGWLDLFSKRYWKGLFIVTVIFEIEVTGSTWK